MEKHFYFLKLLLRYLSRTSKLLGEGEKMKRMLGPQCSGESFHFFVLWIKK